MLDVLCVGDVNQDIITTPLDDYPKRNEQVVIPEFKYYLGGSSAICSAACQSLGLKTGFVGVVGDDFHGLNLKRKLKAFNVKSYVRVSGRAGTDTTFAITFKNGKRSFITSHGANDELSINDVKNDVLMSSRHLHVSGYWHLKNLRPRLPELFKRAKRHGLSTSFDIGATIEKRDWSRILSLLSDVDVLFLNDYELRLLTKSSMLKGIKKLIPLVSVLALHLGGEGAMACTKDKRVRMDSFNVKVINPTGAGDTFNAGFLYAYLRNELLGSCLKHALANACIYISRSEQRFPSINEVRKFIRSNP